MQISIQDSERASADHIAGYKGAFARKRALAAEVVRLEIPLTVNAVMHRANIDRIERMVDARARARRQPGRDRARAVLRLGAEEPRRADADARAGRARRRRRSRNCAQRHHGQIVIDAVVPDYYARLPEALRRRLGPALAQRHAGGQGAALPRRRVDPRPRILVGARAFARRHLGEFAGLQCLPRHRLDAGAVPSCARREIDFGGCRCQAFALTGDARATDPVCHLSPRHDEVQASPPCRRTRPTPTGGM